MRVLLEDGFSIEKGTGIGRYTQSLANELGRRPEVEVFPPPAREFIRKIRPMGARRVVYAAWLETGFQRQVRKLAPDLIHFTNHLVPRARKSGARYVVTIHDLTAWRFPEALPSFYRQYNRIVVPRAVKLADLVLCPSDAVRNEVISHFDLKPALVRTAWNADSKLPELSAQAQEEISSRFRKNLGIQKPFVLFVGTLEWRKNVTTLVEAFARVAKEADLQLVLAGRFGYGFPEIEAAIQRQGCRERYVLTGYVSDEELSMLYTMAELFAYPSRYEGFGIPLVEAMSFGLPIVASRIPASEEVAREAALYYDDPEDASALAEQILILLGNSTLGSELGSRGRRRAELFRWEQVIQMYLDAYQSCLGRN